MNSRFDRTWWKKEGKNLKTTKRNFPQADSVYSVFILRSYMPACRVNRDKGYRLAWQIKYLAIQNARRREWSALTEGSARNEAAILSTDYRSIDFQRTRISSAFLFLCSRLDFVSVCHEGIFLVLRVFEFYFSRWNAAHVRERFGFRRNLESIATETSFFLI